MKLFSNSHTRRSTAFMALVVWTFALASGLANACTLETPGNHPHIAAGHASDVHPADAKVAWTNDVIAIDDEHDDDSTSLKGSCLKASSNDSNAQTKLPSGANPTDPSLPPLLAFARHAPPPIALVSGWVDEFQDPAKGQPFRLRHARLTL